MPTFGAVALDRLLEPGASKSVDKSVPSLNYPPKPKPLPNTKPIPNSNSNLERRNSASTIERKFSRPQISPALYATPELTPLPDSPSSFPPSPYMINRNGRGPHLWKSFSVDDVSSQGKTLDENKVNGNTKDVETKVVDLSNGSSVAFSTSESNGEKHVNGVHGTFIAQGHTNGIHPAPGEHMYGLRDCGVGCSNDNLECSVTRDGLGMENHVQKVVLPESDGELDDFFDPRESMSYASSTDGEDVGTESSVKLSASACIGEFFDAREEPSPETWPNPSLIDVEAELRGVRLSLLMEIEKRKQAEEHLNNMQSMWQRTREQLALVGLTLPEYPIASDDAQQVDSKPAEELCQQVYLARLVSESVGRGVARAEVEMEMEAQIDAKNFEIARLWDRLQYYEGVNREMFQRNQEAIEMGRRMRQIRKRRQRWFWGAIATAITLGTAALAWSYLPIPKGSGLTGDSQVPENDDAATS